jgi:hypothetical protein
MPTETYTRNGHSVAITVDQESTGWFTWSYIIDEDGFTEMRDRPLDTLDEAMDAAKNHANAKADALRPDA